MDLTWIFVINIFVDIFWQLSIFSIFIAKPAITSFVQTSVNTQGGYERVMCFFVNSSAILDAVADVHAETSFENILQFTKSKEMNILKSN